MSEKKSQQVNSSHDDSCENIIFSINELIKKIKSGRAVQRDLEMCEKLTNSLQNSLKRFKDISSLNQWMIRETIEMSRYTCSRYGSASKNDKI